MKSFFIKRIFDLLISFLGIIILLPIWVLVSIFIYLEDGLPIIYIQSRMGRSGKIFKIFKFRSMPHTAQQDNPTTKIGRFLRSTGIDETLQLINILKNEMSLVGPRPERLELVRGYQKLIPGYDRRHSIKPGLTGMAQVYGEHDTPPEQKLRYDITYINTRTFLMDIKLLWLSLNKTFKGLCDK